MKYKYIKAPLGKGDLVEITVKYLPDLISNRRYYQFTAIDYTSRWRPMKIYEDYANSSSIMFLEELIKITLFRIQAIKTDRGSNLINRYTDHLKSSDRMNPRLHPFDLLSRKLNIIHSLIGPGKPAQNGKIERSHRTDQEMLYDKNGFKTLKDLKAKMKIWNDEYHSPERCGLNGKTPKEMLTLLSINEPPKVCG